jgi:hypothetical protein
MRGQGRLIAGYLAVAAASLWLRSAIPVWAIVAPHDDFLFVRLAYNLGGGLWLGQFDNLTLAKGMAYPAFILAAFLAGIPLKIAEQSAYLAAAGLAAWLVARLTGKQWVAFALFVLLSFNPLLWHPQLARVIREGLYVSLSFVIVILAAAVLLPRKDARPSLTVRNLLLIALGLAGAVYWLTREEGIWLGPALAVLLAAGAINPWRERKNGEPNVGLSRAVLRAVPAFMLVLAIFAGVVGAVAAMNDLRYGAFTTNEFQSSSFRAAYGAVARIRHREWRRYIVFPKDARDKAYAVSAAARELRPALDGESGENWRRIACGEARIDPCPEIPGGWFMWAFRDAVALAGHYSSARDALAFYRRLAGEINAACDDGRLSCGGAGVSIFPPFRRHYVADVLAQVPALARALTRFGDGEVGPRANIGPSYFVELFSDLVGPVSALQADRIMLTGTIAPKGAIVQIVVHDRSGEPHTTTVKRLPPPTVAAPDRFASPVFDLETDCLRPTCDLVVKADASEQAVGLSTVTERQVIASPDFEVSIDFVRQRGPSRVPVASEMRRNVQLTIAHAIGLTYAAAMPFLTALALIGVIIAVAVRPSRRASAGVLALVLACAAAVASRAVLLAYHEVTLLPGAVNPVYLSPASPFLIAFVLLGLYLGILALHELRSARRREHEANGQPSR